jgi:hypothetical protein
VIFTVADIAVAPLLFVTTAFIAYDPAGTLLQVREYGSVVSELISVEPAQKETLETLPDPPVAVAVSAIVAGAV